MSLVKTFTTILKFLSLESVESWNGIATVIDKSYGAPYTIVPDVDMNKRERCGIYK